jgi:hypothetical protein
MLYENHLAEYHTLVPSPKSMLVGVEIDARTHTAVAIDAFRRLATTCGLSVAEEAAVLGMSEAALLRWRSNGVLEVGKETAERAGYILRIIAGLYMAFSGEAFADDWLRCSNEAFRGASPLQRILGDLDGLVDVLLHVELVLD